MVFVVGENLLARIYIFGGIQNSAWPNLFPGVCAAANFQNSARSCESIFLLVAGVGIALVGVIGDGR